MNEISVTEQMSGTPVMETVPAQMPEAAPPAETAAGAEPTAGTGAQGAPQGAQSAPKEYAAFSMPEGVEAGDPAIQAGINEAAPIFREMGLTQEQAQKLVDLHMKHWVGAAAQVDDAAERRRVAQVDAWGEETRRHPEFGGARLNESIGAVKLAIDRLGGMRLHDALDSTGIINHPEIFGAFVKIGRLMREDRAAGAPAIGAAAEGPAAMAARVYPNMRSMNGGR